MTEHNMKHLEQLEAVALSDVAVLRRKEATYQGSWKRAGGRSAWFMFRRNIDRLLVMLAPPPPMDKNSVGGWHERGTTDEGYVQLLPKELDHIQSRLRAEDIFAQIEADPTGKDGSVLACLRDLRRYATLVEAEMVSRGAVEVEERAGPSNKCEMDWYVIVAHLLKVTRPEAVKAVDRVLTTGEAPQLCAKCGGALLPQETVWWQDGKTYHFENCSPEWERTRNQRMEPSRTVGKDPNLLAPYGPGTPEDGGQHAKPDLVYPWVLCEADLVHLLGDHVVTRGRIYKPWSRQAQPLEPSITRADREALVAFATDEEKPEDARRLVKDVLKLYLSVNPNWLVLDIVRAPGQWRDLWPVLPRERNHTELKEAPAWQESLYSWRENATKYDLRGNYLAWSEGNDPVQ